MEKHLKEIKDFILENCEHKPLRDLVEQEGYIAGGAIRSLMHKKFGEPEVVPSYKPFTSTKDNPLTHINDYDVFFKSREAATEFVNIIEYGLAGQLDKLTPLAQTLDVGPKHMKNPNYEKRFTAKEFTLFGNFDKHKTENAYTFKACVNYDEPKRNNELYQFITKYTGSPETNVARFDFTSCMGYYDFKTEHLHVTPETAQAIKDKKLIFNPECMNPLSSLKRINKFQDMGYTIDNENFQKLWQAIGEQHTYKEILELIQKGIPNY